MRKQDERSAGQVIMRLLFLGYCALMLWLLFGQRMETGAAEKNWNFTPFATLTLYFKLLNNTASSNLQRHAVINLAGNVVMFIPLGYFLCAIWKKLRPFFACLLGSFLIIISIEATQYLTGLGSCDVDDLILNLPGAMMGWSVCRLCTRKRP